MNICTVDGCKNIVEAKAMCAKHYTRFLRYGDANMVRVRMGEATAFFDLMLGCSELDACIEWPFTTSGSDSRPWIRRHGKGGYVARFLCLETKGSPPSPTHQAAHNCGNKGCVNPNHLRWATPSENIQDTFHHGTANVGERQGASKLTIDDVREIRALDGQISQRALAKRFGVHPMHIHKIVRRKAWAHLD